MKEDIILISAYCPSIQKMDKLRKLVNQLQTFREKYDILIVSHTEIAIDIQNKVDLFLYDKKNELLTDWDLINQPWFSPGDGQDRRIQSGLLTGRNTHLTIWRMLILGFSLVKNIGYKKVHHIEYDCEIRDDFEIEENSKLLDDYDFIYYKDIKKENVDDILFGSFQSLKIESLPRDLLILNEDNIKDMIRKSFSKSPEGMFENILINNGKVKVKNRVLLEKNGNKFATSENDETFNPWGVPYIDLKDNKINFIAWNTSKKDGVNYTIIVNDNNILKSDKLLKDHWTILGLDYIENIHKIIIVEDDTIRDTIKFNSNEDKELFKKISFRFN
jgi:hypothetical protein